MTAEEHDHMQELEGKVKRYRSRIVALKAKLEAVSIPTCSGCHQRMTIGPAFECLDCGARIWALEEPD